MSQAYLDWNLWDAALLCLGGSGLLFIGAGLLSWRNGGSY